MDYRTIDVAIRDGIGWLTFNRPQVLNAFDPELIDETNRALRVLATDEGVGAVHRSRAGRAFSAGFDIKARRWRESARPRNGARCWRPISTSSCSSGLPETDDRRRSRLTALAALSS
jgi:enoyl-CoA hydratase/carnithine racemase